MRASFVITLAIVLMLACEKATPPPPTPARPDPALYIIVLDLTRSLGANQDASMQESIKALTGALPARSHIVVLPLGGYVSKAGVLVDVRLPDDRFARERAEFLRKRRALPSMIAQSVAAFRRGITDPAFVRNTCISDAIREAEQLIAGRRGKGPVELIFLSDMLESCPDSILGGRLSLERHDLRAELERAERLSPGQHLADLQGATVTAILPSTGPTASVTAEPQSHELPDFWRLIFAHCNSGTFYLGSTIPERLRPER
jgi:hypothetical protein